MDSVRYSVTKTATQPAMAGLMQWFQVTCPACTAALQVRLPEGVTSVQCSQCKAVFAVQVQPIALSANSSVPAPKRSRKRKGGNKAESSAEPNRTLSAYNVFMKSEVARVKAERPELPHREAFKMAAENWQTSPMNPQNGGERFPLKALATITAVAEDPMGTGDDGAGPSSAGASERGPRMAALDGAGPGDDGDGLDDGEAEDEDEDDDDDDDDDDGP